MSKLRLEVDELCVESFETTKDAGDKVGTVHGHSGASDSTCLEKVCTCAEDTEWDITCGNCTHDGTCGQDCPTHWYCPTRYYYPGC